MMILSAQNERAEIFYTLQGEGINTGKPAIFIRSAGCNLHCVWCDTAYTWNWNATSFSHVRDQDDKAYKFDKASRTVKCSTDEIVATILDKKCSHLVLTGGEPLLQQKGWLAVLAALNKVRPFTAEVETNGTLMPDADFDAYITHYNVSPKLQNSKMDVNVRLLKPVLQHFVLQGKAWFKFVISSDADVDEVLACVSSFDIPRERVFLMPEGTSKMTIESRLAGLSALCQENGFRLGDRLHIRLGIA